MDTREEYNLLKKQLCTVIGEGAVESAETQFNHVVNETHLGCSASLLHDFLRLIELKALLANISVKEEVLHYIRFQARGGDQRAYELERMIKLKG